MLSIILFLESIGTGELLLILMFILFFFGSKKIPELARGIGKVMREMKDAVHGIQNDIHQRGKQEELKVIEDVKKEFKAPDNKAE